MWIKENPDTFLIGIDLSTVSKLWMFLRKVTIELPYEPAIPLLDIYAEELKSASQRDVCISMFMTVSFTIAKTWKQSKCPLMNE